MGGRRATLRLALDCDNSCVFCAQRGLAPAALSLEEARARLTALRADGAEAVTFVGGEPLLVEWLPKIIAAARALGFAGVGVQTNARALAARAESLVAAGLGDVHVSIHGGAAEVHDYHTGVGGSFAALWAGVAAARALGVTVVATTVVTRSNFRVLNDLPPLLAARGVAAWRLTLPSVAGAAAAAFDRVVPRLGLAVPFMLLSLENAMRRGVLTFLDGVPLCALGHYVTRALPSEAPGAFGERCQACAARASCAGVDAAYLARWREEELHARAAPHVLAAHALAALFVGIGERALTAPPTAAASSRRALPLHRPQPARAEVPASTPRKSGESLREILPALFPAQVEDK